jgi:hypothetical protein
MQKFMTALAMLGALQAGACATIIEGSNQNVNVSAVESGSGTEIQGAECTLTSPSIGTQRVTTPGSVKLEKSKNSVSVLCNKSGYAAGTGTIASHFAAATVGNFLIGGLIGVGIDAASGAANKYDDKIAVTMARLPEPPPEPGRTAATRRAPPPPPAAPVAEPAVSPAPGKPPKCSEVGGYEAYKAKTGQICTL